MDRESFNNANSELSPEQKEAKDRMIELLSAGKTDLALEIKRKANLPEQIVQSKEVQEVIEKQIVYFVSAGFGYLAQEVIESFDVPKELVDKAARKGLTWALEHMQSGDLDNIVIPTSEEFNIALNTEELIEAAKVGIEKLFVQEHNSEAVKRVKKFFGLS
ncbi:MAG: hypothetical protein A3J47_01895 [Candidatus Yanofskybacteria bacterium RIFCSPHIGHO2_02_FULL_43_22]|uniref:Uncharacterized protein n=1 Tax=Candidatus Yanofskybacteria bacterium RIFCSPHIGHO2_02_FULL_43_22 TaxID=1802681 RepID=A0A1F8FMY7_9BACT|nr:MAG: hypothetical protein A3J47_01895 [Candidatus Yanofskybacteria bacterium RIFCSPHIGHO2_02_FULL_43_22]